MRESLSLYQIETELAELLNVREELIELGEDLAPIEQAIAEYVKREIAKVDGIRSYLKHAEMMAAAAKVEAVVQEERAIAWQGRIERLKEFCKRTMEAMTWTEGKPRRIDGKLGSLTLKTNGGKQEVVITQESLIPEDLVQYEGRISGQAWQIIRKAVMALPTEEWGRFAGPAHVQMERVPHKGRIAEALSAKCERCDGNGVVEDFTENDQLIEGELPCKACDGDGKARVPGAHFASRANHIVVK